MLPPTYMVNTQIFQIAELANANVMVSTVFANWCDSQKLMYSAKSLQKIPFNDLSPKLHIHKGCLDDYHLIVGKKYLILSYLKNIYLKEIFNLGINIAVFPEECIT